MSKSFIEKMMLGKDYQKVIEQREQDKQKEQMKSQEVQQNKTDNLHVLKGQDNDFQKDSYKSWNNFYLKEKFFYTQIFDQSNKGLLNKCLKDLINDEEAVKEKIIGRKFKLGANKKEKDQKMKEKQNYINKEFSNQKDIKKQIEQFQTQKEQEYAQEKESNKNKENLSQEKSDYKKALILNQCWEDFMLDYLSQCHSEEQIKQKIMQSDFTGAKVLIKDSLSICQKNMKGIIIREGLNSFKIINEQNKVKTVLKKTCIFQFSLREKKITILGPLLTQPLEMRLKQKWKSNHIFKICKKVLKVFPLEFQKQIIQHINQIINKKR